MLGTHNTSPAPKPPIIQNPTSLLPWPDRLPEQVALLRKLISNHDKNVVPPTAETLSAHFGRRHGFFNNFGCGKAASR
jgi:hypothetical protein